jgi:hypothetical protein
MRGMRFVGHLRLSLWLCALGAVVLYVFFVSLARIRIEELAGLTAFVAGFCLLLFVRGLRLNHELADPGGDPRLRRALNRQRERRGF